MILFRNMQMGYLSMVYLGQLVDILDEVLVGASVAYNIDTHEFFYLQLHGVEGGAWQTRFFLLIDRDMCPFLFNILEGDAPC
jgi:hypothetical protein